MRWAALALLLSGCGNLWIPSAGTPGALFPHPEGYKDDGAHATDALDLATCMQCHAVAEGDTVAGVTPVAPTCNSCHVHPHTQEFSAGEVHGAAWLADKTKCVACHGEEGNLPPRGERYGLCVGCHSTFPHPEGWADPSAHGAALTERGSAAACAGCHGADGEALAPTSRCHTCHAAFPHPTDWGLPAIHGDAFRTQTPAPGDPGCTGACHDGASGPADRTCGSCHNVFPHPDTWKTGHIRSAQNRGLASCEGCHKPGVDRGPVLPVPCAAACHQEVSP